MAKRAQQWANQSYFYVNIKKIIRSMAEQQKYKNHKKNIEKKKKLLQTYIYFNIHDKHIWFIINM